MDKGTGSLTGRELQIFSGNLRTIMEKHGKGEGFRKDYVFFFGGLCILFIGAYLIAGTIF